MPQLGIDRGQALKVGFLAPLTGQLKSWSEPGYHGCLLWKDRVNSGGGIRVGDVRYMVDIIPFDTELSATRALEGARKLVLQDGVKIVAMLGGDDFTRPVREFLTRQRMLVTTLLPSDLSPDAPTLVAPSEVHPIYNVTGVDWLKRHVPEVKTAALCAQDDALGLPSIATYRAAFEAAGIKLGSEILFPVETTDFKSIVSRLLATRPDVLCWDTAYEPFVHSLTIEAYKQGFDGWILSCTCDNYRELIEHTSSAFMEKFVFQFPDFDDDRLNEPQINFNNPKEFFEQFCERYPGTWSAVSWEYASILDLWKSAVESARTFEPMTVLAMLKVGGKGHHVFGDAMWWGRELFGIDNALVGDWPVVTIKNNRARIVEFGSITRWWMENSHLLVKQMRDLNLMWDQREQLMATSR